LKKRGRKKKTQTDSKKNIQKNVKINRQKEDDASFESTDSESYGTFELSDTESIDANQTHVAETNIEPIDYNKSDISISNMKKKNAKEKKKIFVSKKATRSESKAKKINSNNAVLFPNVVSTISVFEDHIPDQRTSINFNGESMRVINSCNIDYFLFSFWVLSKLLPYRFVRQIPKLRYAKEIKNIIKHINSNDWNKAKEVWINNVINYLPDADQINLYGTERDNFLQYLSQFQIYDKIQYCSSNCQRNKLTIFKDADMIMLYVNPQVTLDPNLVKSPFCEKCNSSKILTYTFKNKPNFIFIDSYDVKSTYLNDYPSEFIFGNLSFKRLCTTLYNGNNHFVGVFVIEDNYFVVDDTNDQVIYLDKDDSNNDFFNTWNASISLYYLEKNDVLQ
jgi:hypothetical protein